MFRNVHSCEFKHAVLFFHRGSDLRIPSRHNKIRPKKEGKRDLKTVQMIDAPRAIHYAAVYCIYGIQ